LLLPPYFSYIVRHNPKKIEKMECPVCKNPGLPEDAKSCPKCNSDLEAFELTKKIKKAGKGRLVFGYVASALFLVILIVWIMNCLSNWSSDEKPIDAIANSEITKLAQELEQEKKLNAQLQTRNKELKTELGKKVQSEAKKQQEWSVKEGESLFVIARKVYGNGFNYPIIAKDNNISDPNIIQVGQKLVIYY